MVQVGQLLQHSLNTARASLIGGQSGTQTAAVTFGGTTPSITAVTEIWNGTNWTNSTSMSTARQSLGRGGTSTAALGSGGYVTGAVATTEEFTGAAATTKTVTVS
jgi:hypothetical protein